IGIDPKEEGDRLKDVPKEFRKFTRLFRREEEVRLPLRSRWDHIIKLKLGTQLGYFKIYPINEKEREILRKYIEKNLKIGKIRRSKSEVGYPIFFIIKKDGGRRPYIDYQQLNDITKKNRYPLIFIRELRDRLRDKKWFIILDLKVVYHMIRIKEGDE